MQKSREERARSAAQKAADELAAARQQEDHVTSPQGEGGGGILSSVQESARSVMGAVRSTFSSGGGAAGRGEGDGAEEEAHTAMGNKTAAEAKDVARGAMESAREYAVEAKEEARRALAGDAVGRKGETAESAWQQGQDVRRRAAEKAAEEAQREPPSEEEKGRAATENIYGKAKGATGAFREKMVMPTDVVERKRAEAAAARHGGGEDDDWQTAAGSRGGGVVDDEEEDVMLRVKDADQMTGQAFNDVGKMGGEGTGMPRRR